VARGAIESFEEYKKVNVKESNRMLENERVEKKTDGKLPQHICKK
jgi:hypothetical protein